MSMRNLSQARSTRSKHVEFAPDPPDIANDEPLTDVLDKLARYLSKVVHIPQTFEELSTVAHGHVLSPLVESLVENVHHPAIVAVLLALRPHFETLEEVDGEGLNLTRAYACEVVAWRFTTHLSEREAVEYLLYELPETPDRHHRRRQEADLESEPGSHPGKYDGASSSSEATERTRLLSLRKSRTTESADENLQPDEAPSADFGMLVDTFQGLSALEIAAVCNAKKFLCQRPVQRIINGVWRGDIVFWESLSVHTVKKPQFHDPKRCDPYCRLRVPLYAKCYEVFYFAVFLALYYAVLVQRDPSRVTAVEVLLLIWFAAFAYDEFGAYLDAGLTFYAADFWSLWDFGIIALGIAYFITRVVGLSKYDAHIIETSFDILSLEALFLVPRVCSLLSLHPFFGTLIPCLKDMTKYSTQFLGLVAILYCGFLTTFILLGRDAYTPTAMSWILIKVFFGSSYLGFDAADKISPVLGPPLMLIFVWLTNILLITVLISVLSNRVSAVMARAREEYLFLYSVFVLEASTSSRLTYYLPPLNLLSLVLRPLRLLGLSAEHLRALRIAVLKLTHAPHVMLIYIYEQGLRRGSAVHKPRVSAGPEVSSRPSTPILRPPPVKLSRSHSNRVASVRSAMLSNPAFFSSPRSKSPRSSMRRGGGGVGGLSASNQSTLEFSQHAQIFKLTGQVEELTAKVDELLAAMTRGSQNVVNAEMEEQEEQTA